MEGNIYPAAEDNQERKRVSATIVWTREYDRFVLASFTTSGVPVPAR